MMSSSIVLPPFLLLMVGALLLPVIPGVLKKVAVLLLPVLSLLNVLNYAEGSYYSFAPVVGEVMTLSLTPVVVDSASLLWSYIFHLICLLASLFLINTRKPIELSAGLFYTGAALGVVFAGDLITFFVFWELLTFGAVFLILPVGSEHSFRAAMRYLLVHVVGGLVLLAGVIMYSMETGSLALEAIPYGVHSIGSLLLFLGMGVNCAWPMMHSWLTDTYPEATIGGVLFMSALTTKTAVYALWRVFPGEEWLVGIGLAMAGLPIFYAVIENDLRRVLAYSLMNQVGFMVVGIGLGTELSLNGTAAHVVTHILYKSLLFMSVGAVMYRTGKSKATELGGLYKYMPFTCACCVVGAASISAFPLFSGFVSKSMVMSAAAAEHYTVVWFVLLFAAAGVFHHAGIKIPFFAFFSHDSGLRPEKAPLNMRIAMGLTALGCIALGAFPHQLLYPLLPYDAPYEPYTAFHVVGQLQLLGFSALAFCLLLLSGLYPAEIRSVNLDVDWIYRKGAALGYQFVDWFFNGLNAVADSLTKVVVSDVASFSTRAPMRLAMTVMPPLWRMAGLSAEETQEQRRMWNRSMRSGALPIGLGVVTAVTVMFMLFFSTLM